jgi:hypothetical protein
VQQAAKVDNDGARTRAPFPHEAEMQKSEATYKIEVEVGQSYKS